HRLHLRLGVARPRGGADGHRLREPLDVLRAELHADRTEVLVEPVATLGARDRHDIAALREQPGEHQLAGRAALLARELLYFFHELDVALEILFLEPWMLAATVVDGNVGDLVHLAGEEATAERRVGDERDPELAQRRYRLLGLDAVEQRELHLHGRDRMHAVRAPDRGRRRLREAEETNLAGLDQA